MCTCKYTSIFTLLIVIVYCNCYFVIVHLEGFFIWPIVLVIVAPSILISAEAPFDRNSLKIVKLVLLGLFLITRKLFHFFLIFDSIIML